MSNGRFKITKQADPVEFLSWVLNALHKDMGGTKKSLSSVIYRTFQGELRMESQSVITRDELHGNFANARPIFDIDRGEMVSFMSRSVLICQPEIKTTTSPFLILSLDLPPPPLFQDAIERKNIIPQVNIYTVLQKYDGKTSQESLGQLKRYKCTKLPPYIILHFKRFTKNNFVEEKNPTIITFPLRGLDFRECE